MELYRGLTMAYILTEAGDKIILEDASGFALLESSDITAIAARVTKAPERDWTDKTADRNYTDKTLDW